MKQKDKDLSRLFSKNCPQKVGEGKFGEPLPDKAEDRMFLLSVETLETRAIPHDPKCLHEATPTFSNSGDRLAYLCVRSTNELELYSAAPFGGAPKLITAFSNFPAGFTWSAGDRKLLLALASDSGPDLHEIVLANGSVRRLDFAPNATWPTVSLRGDKLAYSASFDNINIWRQDILHPHGSPLKLISSTRNTIPNTLLTAGTLSLDPPGEVPRKFG
jgi:hypothetical protein